LNRRPTGHAGRSRGFTLIEVMVALLIVSVGLAALMITVSSTARTSGYLRDKTVAQWIALNRISEVRLNMNTGAPGSMGTAADTGELNFANRTWHYDTRYFDTNVASMKRVVVRVYAGDAKTKGNALSESYGFVGTSLSPPGSSNAVDWTLGSTAATAGTGVSSSGISPSPVQTSTPNGGTATGTSAPGGVVPLPTAPNTSQ
jgi:general secretion pathway protein I